MAKACSGKSGLDWLDRSFDIARVLVSRTDAGGLARCFMWTRDNSLTEARLWSRCRRTSKAEHFPPESDAANASQKSRYRIYTAVIQSVLAQRATCRRKAE